MLLQTLETVRTRKPEHNVGLKQSHPLAKTIVGLFSTLSGNVFLEAVKNANGSQSGNPLVIATQEGKMISFDNTDDILRTASHFSPAAKTQWGCLVWKYDSAGTNRPFQSSGSTVYEGVVIGISGTNISVQWGDGTGRGAVDRRTYNFARTQTDGEILKIAYKITGNTTAVLFLDGQEIALDSTSGSANTYVAGTTAGRIGHRLLASVSYGVGAVGFLAFGDGLPETEELKSLSINPYQLLEDEIDSIPYAFDVGAIAVSLTAAAQSAEAFSAVATASAAVTEGATSGDTPGGAAAALAALDAAATSADLQAALATAQAAVTEGVVSDEVWAADAAALASILAAALSGDAFTGAVTTPGVQTGALTAGSSSEATFLGAVQAIASITAGALAGDTLTAVVRNVAALTAAALAGDTQTGATRAIAALTADAVSADSQAGSAAAGSALTGGAVAGATFDIAGEIGRLVANITIQRAIDGAILIGKAIDGDVTIN